VSLPPGSQVGNIMPTPEVSLVPAFGPGWPAGFTTDAELLFSTNGGFTQKGVTLATGQGILPVGTCLGRVTATKLYVPYNAGNSDGSQVPRGFLRTAADTGTTLYPRGLMANIVIRGILKSSLVSGADTNAITLLGARVDTVIGSFTF
jgi:Bacteriophage lambda head decoration protein D